MAFQYYVLSQQGYEIKKAFVVHIDGEYVREEVLEIDKLFTLTDVFDEIVLLQDEIPHRIQAIENALADEENEPIIEEECFCDFCKEAMGIPEYSIFKSK